VVIHAIAYLAAYKIAFAGLILSGAIGEFMFALRRVGVNAMVVEMIPLLLILGYALLWVWFCVSLYRSAPNAETASGAHRARRAAQIAGILLAAALIVTIALGFRR